MKLIGVVSFTFCAMVLCQGASPGNVANTYADLKRLVLKKMPWRSMSAPESAKPTCDFKQCEKVQNLCHTGVCVVTSDCALKCRCPKGYTGFFCGVKVSDLVTTISLELTSKMKESRILRGLLKNSSTATAETASTTEADAVTTAPPLTSSVAPETKSNT